MSDGTWFWHSGDKAIKGIFVALDMPVVFFDYTTRFDGDKMINDLLTYDPAGTESIYTETWDFTEENTYV